MKNYPSLLLSGIYTSILDSKRKTTDIFCLFLFALLVLGMLGVAVKGWTSDQYQNMLILKDSDGNLCGKQLYQYPYLYFVSPHPQSLWVTVCVKQCPNINDKHLKCYQNSKAGCEPINSADSQNAVQIYQSQPFMKICLPSSQKIRQSISPALNSTLTLGKILLLKQVWSVLVVSALVSIFMSFVIYLLMRYFACYMIYFFSFCIIALLVCFGIFLMVSTEPIILINIQLNHIEKMITGCILLTIGSVLFSLFLCYRHRFNLYANISEVTSRFVNQNCLIGLFSLLVFFIMVFTIFILAVQGLSYYSYGIQQNNNKSQFNMNAWIIVLLPLFIIYSVWTIFFIKESQSFIIAGTVTNWYYGVQKPFYTSLHNYYRFHLGSVCSGSLLYTLFGIFKTIYLILRSQQESSNGIFGFFRSCCSCLCCFCTHYIFNMFNSGAYTLVHIYGQSYCTSATQYLSLMMKHPIATSAISLIQTVFSIMTNLGIIAAASLSSYALLKNQSLNDGITNFHLTMIFSIGISFLIGSLFSSIYSEAIQSIYICFLIESNNNQDSLQTPHQLKNILELSRKQNHIAD